MSLNSKLREQSIYVFYVSFIYSFQKIKIVSIILIYFFINFLSYRLKSLVFLCSIPTQQLKTILFRVCDHFEVSEEVSIQKNQKTVMNSFFEFKRLKVLNKRIYFISDLFLELYLVKVFLDILYVLTGLSFICVILESDHFIIFRTD